MGMLYLCAYKNVDDQPNSQQWFPNTFGVSYDTALSYMVVALLLRKYPRLFVCKLTFNQLVKHNKNILRFLETESEGLREKLSMRTLMSTDNGILAKIEASDDVYVPEITFSTDPDIDCYDFDPESAGEPIDKKRASFHQWMLDQNASGNLQSILYPADSMQEMADAVTKGVMALGFEAKPHPKPFLLGSPQEHPLEFSLFPPPTAFQTSEPSARRAPASRALEYRKQKRLQKK